MVSAAAVVLVTHPDQAHDVWKTLARVPISSLAGALLLILSQFGFQSFRLWTLIPRDVALSLGRTAYAFAIGEWFNIFTPARAGDALKVLLLNRAAGAPISLPKATGAVLADKIVDAGALVLLCAATGLAGLLQAGAEARLPGAWTVAAAVMVLALALLGIHFARPRWLERLTRRRHELVKGLAALKDPVQLLASTSFSMSAWLAELLALRVLCTALGFPLSVPQLVLALTVLNLGISVPVSIANLGLYEAALAFGLNRAGVPLPSAIAIGALHHALQLVATNLGAAGLSLWVAARGGSVRVG